MEQLAFFMQVLAMNAKEFGYMIAACFVLNFVNWIFFFNMFNLLGIRPRKATGIIGVIFAPFLHANFSHFVMNSLPFFILGLMITALTSMYDFYGLAVLICLLSGLLTWAFARDGIHIGASSLITGLYSWILIFTYYNPSGFTFFILAVLFVYLGGIFIGILPSHEYISWEGHLSGFVSGLIIYLVEPYLNLIQDAGTWIGVLKISFQSFLMY